MSKWTCLELTNENFGKNYIVATPSLHSVSADNMISSKLVGQFWHAWLTIRVILYIRTGWAKGRKASLLKIQVCI